MITEKARNTNYFKVGAVERPCRKGEICRKIYSVPEQDRTKKATLAFIKKK